MGLNFLLIGGGNFLRQFATFLAQILVARSVGETAFGQLTTAFSWMLLMVGLGDFGARLYFWRELTRLPEDQREARASHLLWRHLAFSALPLIPVNLLIGWAAPWPLALYLHAYSIAMLFNQTAFDWWFLGQERYGRLLVFNVVSSLILLAGCVVLIHSSNDAVWFALLFSLSFALPGLGLTARRLHKPDWQDLRSFWRLPALSYRYALYDWVQRLYTAFLPLLAWQIFDSATVAHFRIAYLFYALASTASVYLGSAIFNRMSRTDDEDQRKRHLGELACYLVLAVVPLSALARVAAAGFVPLFLPPAYGLSLPHIAILASWLVLPAMANFLREAMVGGGAPTRSMFSYLVAIAVTVVTVALTRGQGPTILSIGALVGEAAGLLFLAIPLVRAMWRAHLASRLAAAISLFWLIETVSPWVLHAVSGLGSYLGLAVAMTALSAPTAALLALYLLAERKILTLYSK
jgi:O-antigen/teichoic acid export membrane protein